MDDTFTGWRKSSLSFSNGNCAEVGVRVGGWRKSSLSAANGACAEVGQGSGPVVGVRDSKNGDAGPVLTFSASAWQEFTDAVKRDLTP